MLFGAMKDPHREQKMPFFKDINHLPENSGQLPSKLLPFIWHFIRQQKWQWLSILVMFAISNALVAAFPYFIKLLIEAFETAGNQEELLQLIFWPAFWCVFLLLIFQPAIVQVGIWMQAKTLPVFINMVRRQLALYMNNHSYEYFQNDFAGRLAGKVIETPEAMGTVVRTTIGAFWFAFVSFIVSACLMATVGWYFALWVVGFIAVYACMMFYFVPRLKAMSTEASDLRSHLRGRYVDTLTNIMTVKLFARKRHEDAYLLESLDETTDCFEKLEKKQWHLWVALEILTSVGWFLIFAMTIYGWIQGTVSTADAAMVLPLMIQITNICWWLSEVFAEYFRRLGEIEEGMQTIVKHRDVKDVPNASELQIANASIDLKDVCFSYGDKPVFENLNLSIKPGEKIGLIGHSGAGKSTLMQIILRLYDIQTGSIMIDGQDISKVKQDSLRRQIAVIPQMTDMLHRSIRDNVVYGKLDAHDEDVFAAAKKARADEFIDDLYDNEGNRGYDAKVGERGVKLSGGQRQRIAIARAVLKDAPILILDEATSALDSESEKLIQESLQELMVGKTVIAIAHRLSTIAHLDRLIVMQDGKIIEDGSHDNLIAKNGIYAKLWSMQSGGFLKTK